jgi:hypothetical protein
VSRHPPRRVFRLRADWAAHQVSAGRCHTVPGWPHGWRALLLRFCDFTQADRRPPRQQRITIRARCDTWNSASSASAEIFSDTGARGIPGVAAAHHRYTAIARIAKHLEGGVELRAQAIPHPITQTPASVVLVRFTADRRRTCRSPAQTFRSEIAGSARCPAATQARGASTLPSLTRSALGNRGQRSSRLQCRKSSGCDRLPRRHCCRS